jgi:ABC-2 type transport system ATP-binding protein
LEETPADPHSAAMIRASGLVKHYGDVRAVDGVSFSVTRGEIVGFLGPNGAGKSTTMKMLTGYLYPDEGEVWLGGLPVDGESLQARTHLGYLPEHTPLYREMRVDRYLSFVGELRGLRGAACRAAFERVVETTGLEGYTTRRIRTLSKGYRQRVGLAQALISDPDVLILDEPTSGLDPAEIVRIRDRILGLSESKTILLSTHVLSDVKEICTRVIMIAGGRIVEDSGLAELTEGKGEALVLVLIADEQSVSDALRDVEGVLRVDVSGRSGEGRVQFHLEVQDRFGVAERLSAMAASRGWPLLELRHEVPTLETVFLNRTRRVGAGDAPGTDAGATEEPES